SNEGSTALRAENPILGTTRARSSARSADERLRSGALRGRIAQRPLHRWVGRRGAVEYAPIIALKPI
ncbi:MAG: hypothetical protein KDJ54_08835, partial [Candidatus Competibacteraceae bacterium]|nr:hypothetical protein [Candidatus Competibacteraceae bacterium]